MIRPIQPISTAEAQSKYAPRWHTIITLVCVLCFSHPRLNSSRLLLLILVLHALVAFGTCYEVVAPHFYFYVASVARARVCVCDALFR